MGKYKNIKYELNELINEKIELNLKKSEAKQQNKTDKIRSIKTIETYRQAVNDFSHWCKDKGINRLEKLDRDILAEYLKYRNNYCSAWTVSRDMTMLNRLMGYGFTKQELELKKRQVKDIKRGRAGQLHQGALIKNKNQVIIAKAFGLRRRCVLQVRPCDFIRNSNNKIIGVKVTGKGGKTRIAPILEAYTEQVAQILNNKPTDEILFTEYSKSINNHEFRAEYFHSLYCELKQKKENGQEYDIFSLYSLNYGDRTNAKGKDISKDDYKGLDREIVNICSKALGHNRLDILKFYDYKFN